MARWAEIIEMSLNLEQASDIVERMGSEIADKSLAARRAFSLDGLKELDALYEQLLSNLKLAMSVFFSGDVTSARRLRRSKHRFRILNRRYSHAHVDRLHQQNVQSIETSSLHLGSRPCSARLFVQLPTGCLPPMQGDRKSVV